MKTDFIKAVDLEKTYQIGEIKINAVKNLSFSINEGELVIIIGPSGAGKTTLLNLLGGMDTLTSGSLIVDDIDLKDLNTRKMTLYRRTDVGFVFQFYNLMPNLTALENIELATEVTKDALNAKEMLEKVGLKDRMQNFPAQLSGGEQQRVSIARALAKNPKLLLCDEPTGALDYVTGKSILSLLSDVARKDKKTVVIVTHNSALKDMADKVIYVKNGTVEKTVVNKNPMDISEIEW